MAPEKSADIAPDQKYSYSNANYLLLGKILDRTLGYIYRHYIKSEILATLWITHTFSLQSEVNLNDVTSGYTVVFYGDLKYNDFVNSAGSKVVPAEDVGIFLKTLNDGFLLNNHDQIIYSSIYEYRHTGLLPGYSSIACYYKDIDPVVIQYCK